MTGKGQMWYDYKERLLEAFETESFCRVYGWTPDEYRAVSSEDIDLFKGILRGRSLASNNK